MRNYLTEIEIVGAMLVSREGDLCRFSLDYLYAHYNRVCLVLDNWNEKTESIVLEYKNKYPDKTYLKYSDKEVDIKRNKVELGYIKHRFNKIQSHIREIVAIELRKMYEEKPIDILVWIDADELFIDEFPKYLKEFWENKSYKYIMTGIIEVYDKFNFLVKPSSSPHGRVYKYVPELSCLPHRTRTICNPYHDGGGRWKLRNVLVHLCQLKEIDRERRVFYLGKNFNDPAKRLFWVLPKDVRKMTRDEIADYQIGHKQAPSKYPPIFLKEYLDNKKKYLTNLK